MLFILLSKMITESLDEWMHQWMCHFSRQLEYAYNLPHCFKSTCETKEILIWTYHQWILAVKHLSALILWGCRIVWCTLTSWYLVSLLPVSIIHVSVIFLVGFWSWEISFIMWGCRGWGWQAAGTWVLVSREMVGFPAPIGWPGASQSICTQ